MWRCIRSNSHVISLSPAHSGATQTPKQAGAQRKKPLPNSTKKSTFFSSPQSITRPLFSPSQSSTRTTRPTTFLSHISHPAKQNLRKWTLQRLPSSSSRSPVSLAELVRHTEYPRQLAKETVCRVSPSEYRQRRAVETKRRRNAGCVGAWVSRLFGELVGWA